MQVTYNSTTLAQCVVTQRRCIRFLRMIALCLILTSVPFTLSGQGCSSYSNCDCSTSINPSYCGECATIGVLVAAGCAYSGNCPISKGEEVYQQCMAQMQPPPPPAPKATSANSSCWVGVESVRGPRSPVKSPLAVRHPASVTSSSCGITFVDPVPNLQDPKSPTAIAGGPQAWATRGRNVTGIAADGVARIVVVIGGAQYAGQGIDVSILDEIGSAVDSSQTSQYGSLSSVNETETKTTVHVVAQQANGTILAFAEYYAPLDFSRGGNDDGAQNRLVKIQASASDGSFTTDKTSLTIWCPPVILVHGLWGDGSNWLTFDPLFAESQFLFYAVDYSYTVVVLPNLNSIADPILLQEASYGSLGGWKASSLGVGYNAPVVLSQANDFIKLFRANKQAAVSQADFVAHSMGGMVFRALAGLDGYADASTFGQGNVHKLITIGTPHLGTPVATDLLANNASCSRWLLALGRNPVFGLATVAGIQVHGGPYDLTGTGDGQGRSQAIQDLAGHKLAVPMAMIAGSTLPQNGPSSNLPYETCGVLRREPLALRLDSFSDWFYEFGMASDGVVPIESQTNMFSAHYAAFDGVAHSTGTLGRFGLGFSGPVELGAEDSPNHIGIQDQVIQFLNAPLNNANLDKSVFSSVK